MRTTTLSRQLSKERDTTTVPLLTFMQSECRQLRLTFVVGTHNKTLLAGYSGSKEIAFIPTSLAKKPIGGSRWCECRSAAGKGHIAHVYSSLQMASFLTELDLEWMVADQGAQLSLLE
jgi:hypothetical protein